MPVDRAPGAPSTEPSPARLSGPDLSALSDEAHRIVQGELVLLERVVARIEREAKRSPDKIEDLDAQMIELRDAIAEAKEEDIPSLIDQMHQVAAISRKRGQGRSVPVDPKNPYFGHLRLRERKNGGERDVLVGRHTLLDQGDGVTIVDWRNAPVSRLYYRYEEEDDYEEEFDERTLEGRILVRRSLAVQDGELRRVAAPQGTFALDSRACFRETVGSSKPTLQGGAGTAVRVARNQLGVHSDEGSLRADKHLQEITALIDKQQFDLITRADSGIVLIQGGAGSGKTTVALHRVAYLAFQDARRFSPSTMMIVVFNDGLVEYIRHVLPSLGVEGVAVTTYRRWSAQVLAKLRLRIEQQYTGATPDAVGRFKKHPLMLKMIDALVREQQDDVRAQLAERITDRGSAELLKAWDGVAAMPPVVRAERMMKWLSEGRGAELPPKDKTAAGTVLRAAREQARDFVGDWFELNTNASRIRSAIHEHAPGEFSDADVGTITRWCARKVDLDVEHPEQAIPEGAGLDPEDDAILLRLMQAKYGGLFIANKRIEFEHIVIDEAQDLCPLEVRVLLDCASKGRSVTIAGDRAQKMVFDNGFVDWPQLLADAGLPHVEVQPLKITYRSTRQIMEFSRHVLGPLADEDQVVARDGAEVGYFEFTDTGEAVAFLGEALRALMHREPNASVALISRYPQQADVYYEALRIAEVPRLRRVRREDFSFTAGVDVTDVRQVKGLEFDYVVLLEPTRANYPEHVQSRHLMHIGATRAAYQLWLLSVGPRSSLVPDAMANELP
jgi:DNA helicase II / ATP-dependent DNA helicase PcrA